MKSEHGSVPGIVALALMTVLPGVSASTQPRIPAQMVITVRPASGNSQSQNLEAGGLTVLEDNAPAPIVRLQRLSGDLANMQLFVLLDDSTRSSSVGLQLPELKAFLKSLPATIQVAVGYMRNGTVGAIQPFTTDHQKAAEALRLPLGIPGANGSPYFALSDLVKHWPSKQETGRRVVLMLTDGVDRYWGSMVMDDPYVDAAIQNALKQDVMVYSIYLRGAGFYGRSGFTTNFASPGSWKSARKLVAMLTFRD